MNNPATTPMVTISGTISCYDLNLEDGPLVTRSVRFRVPENTPWVDIVDEAMERAFGLPEGEHAVWVMDDENLHEEGVGS